jgi:hypothetical protein
VSWADALEAWATVGGALAATAAALFTGWLLLHEKNQARLARADAAQARARSLTVVDFTAGTKPQFSCDGPLPGQVVLFGGEGVLHNFGSSPAFDVALYINFRQLRTTVSAESVTWPLGLDSARNFDLLVSRAVVKAGGAEPFQAVFTRPDGTSASALATGQVVDMGSGRRNDGSVLIGHQWVLDKSIEPVLAFTDPDGRRWLRFNNGSPTLSPYPVELESDFLNSDLLGKQLQRPDDE